jgi:hypothetical protein
MAFLLIEPGRIINLDYVINIEFHPAHNEKVEGYKTMTLCRPDELIITTTTKVITILGQEAEDLFKYMQQSCDPFYPDPMKGKPQ